MATRAYQILNPAAALGPEDAARVQGAYSKVLVVQWSGLLAGDDGAPFDLPDFADRAVQVSGVPGGASVALEGTIDDTDWAGLTDPQGNLIAVTTAPKIEQIMEVTRKTKPVVTGGDGTTNLTVTVLFRRS